MVVKWRYSLIIACFVIVVWLFFQFEIFTQCFSESSHISLIRDKEKRVITLQTELSNVLERLSALQVAFERRYTGDFYHEDDSQLPTIYAITPTHTRSLQKAELTRQIHTFLHISKFHWIVIEDSINATELVKNLLQKSGLLYTHLNIPTPSEYKLKSNDPNWKKPRGVEQRNLGLEWLRENLDEDNAGIVYFADDDNTYDLELFYEMRSTKTVSVWPVGLVGGLMVERPKVKDGHVVGWLTLWRPERSFAMDMAGFAVNLQLLLKYPEARFSLEASRGYQESSLLEGLIKMDELEPKAENCTKVLVWHTRSEKPNLKQEMKLAKFGKYSDKGIEV